jgi:hypothetical protein
MFSPPPEGQGGGLASQVGGAHHLGSLTMQPRASGEQPPCRPHLAEAARGSPSGAQGPLPPGKGEPSWSLRQRHRASIDNSSGMRPGLPTRLARTTSLGAGGHEVPSVVVSSSGMSGQLRCGLSVAGTAVTVSTSGVPDRLRRSRQSDSVELTAALAAASSAVDSPGLGLRSSGGGTPVGPMTANEEVLPVRLQDFEPYVTVWGTLAEALQPQPLPNGMNSEGHEAAPRAVVVSPLASSIAARVTPGVTPRVGHPRPAPLFLGSGSPAAIAPPPTPFGRPSAYNAAIGSEAEGACHRGLQATTLGVAVAAEALTAAVESVLRAEEDLGGRPGGCSPCTAAARMCFVLSMPTLDAGCSTDLEVLSLCACR